MVTELFIRGRKLNISLVFITQCYILLCQHYFMMKISSKRELQQIAFNHSSDIDFEDSVNLYKKCNAKPCYFNHINILVIDATPASDDPLHFRKNLVERI